MDKSKKYNYDPFYKLIDIPDYKAIYDFIIMPSRTGEITYMIEKGIYKWQK